MSKVVRLWQTDGQTDKTAVAYTALSTAVLRWKLHTNIVYVTDSVNLNVRPTTDAEAICVTAW